MPTLVIPELGSEVAVVRKRRSQIWAPASCSTSSLFPAPPAAQVSERRGEASDRALRGKYSALRLLSGMTMIQISCAGSQTSPVVIRLCCPELALKKKIPFFAAFSFPVSLLCGPSSVFRDRFSHVLCVSLCLGPLQGELKV